MTALRVRTASGNQILGALTPGDRELLEPQLEPVSLQFRQQLEAANRKVESIYFIEKGLASVVAIGGADRRRTEIGVVGREGMTGAAVILGAERSPHETFMQIKGHGQKVGAADLRRLMAQSRSLASCFMRYAHVFAVQSAHTALANAQGKIEERLARWLLMAHDRLDGDDIHLTHEFLSVMLGVRRAGVTMALHHLERALLISTARNCITVVNRKGLEQSANGLYGVPEAEFERLFSMRS